MLRVFKNATLLLPSGELPGGMLIARDGFIDHAGPPVEVPAEADVTDLSGAYLSPGFIDIHIHGGAGADFMDATPAEVETVFRYHMEHGTTSLCPTTATAPLDEILAALDAIDSYALGPQASGRSLGAHIEGPYLAFSKKGCHLPEHVRAPEEREWKQILERTHIASMTLAPELPGARSLIGELRRNGANANAGHSECLFHEMDEAAGWGVNHVTHLYCAMTDAMSNRWRLTPNPRSGGILEAVYLDDRLTSELIADGKHLPREMLLVALRMKGYEKLAIVTDAMRGAGMPDGNYTFGPRHGSAAVVRNGEARIPDGTALASSVCPMNEMVRIMRDLTGCPLWQAVHMASLTPARVLRVDDRLGSLEAGKLADLVVLDDALRVQAVYLTGAPAFAAERGRAVS